VPETQKKDKTWGRNNMGIKSQIERSINRARREGRPADAAKLERDLAQLKKERGDAAWERANKKTYRVTAGDSYFSIAAEQLGDERWVQALLAANPGIDHLRPGMEIRLPRKIGKAPRFTHEEYQALIDRLEKGVQERPQRRPGGNGNSDGAGQPQLPAEEEDALVENLAALFRQIEQQGFQLPDGESQEPADAGIPDEKWKRAARVTKSKLKQLPRKTAPEGPDAGGDDPDWEEITSQPDFYSNLAAQDARGTESDSIETESPSGRQYDLTEWLVEDMVATAEKIFRIDNPRWEDYDLGNRIEKAQDFFGSGKLKDIKIRIEKGVDEGIVLCGEKACGWVDSSVPGNIMFGYSMAASGIPEPIYKGGAGLAQIEDAGIRIDWASSWFDNPQDMAAIEFGVELFEKYGYGLAVGDFKNELRPEILSRFQPTPAEFDHPHEAFPQPNGYQIGEFDNKKVIGRGQ
jgi:hypothetical protein